MSVHSRFARWSLALLLLASFSPSLAAQETRWNELTTRMLQLHKSGNYVEALGVAEERLLVAQRTFGADDVRCAGAFMDIGSTYQWLGKLAEARLAYQRALPIQEKTLGPTHLQVATTSNLIGEMYRLQGQLTEAERAHQRALTIREKALAPTHPDVGISLNNLGLVSVAQKKFAAAEVLYKRALAIFEKVLGPTHRDTVIALDNLAELYYAQGRYAEAEPYWQQVLAIREKTLGASHLDVARTISFLAELYRLQGKPAAAEPLRQRALGIREKALGPNHSDVGISLDGLAVTYVAQGKYEVAEPLHKRALAIFEKALGPTHRDTVIALDNLAELYYAQGRYAEAEPYYQRALATREKVLGPSHLDVAMTLINRGDAEGLRGRYAEAAASFQRALAIREKALGSNHLDVATALAQLAEAYRLQGQPAAAEPLFQRALGIREKVLEPTHPDVGISLDNLALIYVVQGKYAAAEPLHKRALDIFEKAPGPTHRNVATSLNNLAEFHSQLGNYAAAEALHKRALDIREKTLGLIHRDVANSLNNLASLYSAQGKYAAAEPLYKRSLAIEERVGTPLNLATTLGNLSQLYFNQGKFAEAVSGYQSSLAIMESAVGPMHPNVATSLNNLAELYRVQAKYAAAEPLHRRALQIRETVLGGNHPDTGKGLWDLARLYFSWNRPADAQPHFDRALRNFEAQLAQQGAFMTEKERLAFLGSVQGLLPQFLSFGVVFRNQMPMLAAQMYDALLFQKGLVANSMAAMRARIAASGDETAMRLFSALSENKRQLFRLVSSPVKNPEQWRKDVGGLEEQANALERALTTRSSTFAQERQSTPPRWQAVRSRLKPGEAAVEFVRFPSFNGKRWSGLAHYAALVVTAGTAAAPTLVSLGNARTLECGPLNEYSLRINQQDPKGMPCTDGKSALALTPTLYQAFWKPLEPALAKVTRVYVSLDGILNQVALNIVPDENGKLLLDKYDLRVVLSTRDLLRESPPSAAKSAVLIGNPLFTIDQAVQVAAARPHRTTLRGSDEAAGTPTAGRRETSLRGPPWEPLPGTKGELQQVGSVLRTHRWTVAMHEGKDAVVEAIKAVRAPRLLHVATHGDFAADPAEERRETFSLMGVDSPGQPSILNDPMLRSGLFFTGANRYRAGLPPLAGADDGVLTAYEASQLNLNGTELVVLSACKTGLGQARHGEGVFGLRRAFQVAGAQAVMMTMWKVPDQETHELMTLFYQKWLGGADKHEALRAAQQELRKTYPDPSSWGAFVLVGR